jgi:hypothetical protein
MSSITHKQSAKRVAQEPARPSTLQSFLLMAVHLGSFPS